MAIGTTITKQALDAALQADAAWLIRTVQMAQKRHQQYLLTMPNAASLTTLGYTDVDQNNITALTNQFDRINTLLGLGTVPGSATQALVDASNILDPTQSYAN